MKTVVSIIFALSAMTAHASQTCISQDEARETLLQKENLIVKDLQNQFHLKLCKNIPNQGCVTKTYLVTRLLQTKWNDRYQAYLSGSVYSWQCGPGAECWIHATLTCDGTLKLVTISD